MAKARYVVLFPTPSDPTAFMNHYTNVHREIASRIPNCTVTDSTVLQAIGEPAELGNTYFVSVVEFDDMATLEASMATPAGLEMLADFENIKQWYPTVIPTVFVATDGLPVV